MDMTEQLFIVQPEHPIRFVIDYLTSTFPEDIGGSYTKLGNRKWLFSPPEQKSNSRESSELDISNSHTSEDESDGPLDLEIRDRRLSVSAEVMTMFDQEGEQSLTPKSRTDVRRICGNLKKNVLFKSYSENELSRVAHTMFRVEFQAEDVIIQQGRDWDRLFVLETGVVDECHSLFGDEEEVVVSYVQGSSAVFGELAMFHPSPCRNLFRAATDVKAWALHRSSFRKILYESSQMEHEDRKRVLLQVFLYFSLV